MRRIILSEHNSTSSFPTRQPIATAIDEDEKNDSGNTRIVLPSYSPNTILPLPFLSGTTSQTGKSGRRQYVQYIVNVLDSSSNDNVRVFIVIHRYLKKKKDRTRR